MTDISAHAWRTARWAPIAVLAAASFALPAYGNESAAAACVRFVTPGTASAGEQLPVLAYRHRDRKGPLEIRFDGQRVEHRVTRYAAFTAPGVTELFLTFRVPDTAARGSHEIQLYEPGRTAGAPSERLATATVILGP